MRKFFLNILAVAALGFTYLPVTGQDLEYLKVPQLENILNSKDNKLYVINFWATWCAPCIKEFPAFKKVSEEFSDQKVQFIMVSLDFPSQVNEQLIPFLKRNDVKLRVALMTDLDYDSWIDIVDPSWQGDIPATLVFNNVKKKRSFRPGAMDEAGLRNLINANL